MSSFFLPPTPTVLSSIRPRLKNIDRSSAQHLEVTVGDLTVIITDFKEKAKPSSTSATSSSAASSVVDHHSQNGSSSENTEKGLSRSSSPRGEGSSVNGESHWVTPSYPSHPPQATSHLQVHRLLGGENLYIYFRAAQKKTFFVRVPLEWWPVYQRTRCQPWNSVFRKQYEIHFAPSRKL